MKNRAREVMALGIPKGCFCVRNGVRKDILKKIGSSDISSDTAVKKTMYWGQSWVKSPVPWPGKKTSPRDSIIKRAAFTLLALIATVMAAATIVEKTDGANVAREMVYGAPWFVAMWIVLAVTASAWLLRCRLYRRLPVFLLHASFLLILAGALTTHLFGHQGRLHLRTGLAASEYVDSESGKRLALPFTIRLEEFIVQHYPGTSTPRDYCSWLVFANEGDTLRALVSMNSIGKFRGYRFYQTSYDSDRQGSILSVAHDPWGIAITYAGYALLLLSMLAFFFDRQSTFRRLLRGAPLMLLLGLPPLPSRAEAPPAFPKEVAEDFGNLYVYYNGRIAPLQTLARDFTIKLYGHNSYEGLTAEQVLTGWLFYYDDWKEAPMIRIKDKAVREILDIEGSHAALTDFIGTYGYKLDDFLAGVGNHGRAAREANEKYSLACMAATGALWKIFPYAAPEGTESLIWLAPSQRLPSDIPPEQALFVRRSLAFVGDYAQRGEWEEVRAIVGKLRDYQRREAGQAAPSPARFKAERLYNSISNSRPLAMAFLSLGIVSFAYYLFALTKRRSPLNAVRYVLSVILVAASLYLLLLMVLRGMVSGHLPLSNGHETMHAIALVASLFPLFFVHRLPLSLSFGFIIGGAALLVSMMGEGNPQVTNLVPVLSSPLLSLHVATVMVAYALLGFVMLLGVAGLIVWRNHRDEAVRLQRMGLILTYPAVFLLACGIFIGAVWANVSWGRYWGWDPKEVWALITLIIYSFALHSQSLPWFRRPLFFHVFAVTAFLSVLITYFGVNFLLGGLHSYA